MAAAAIVRAVVPTTARRILRRRLVRIAGESVMRGYLGEPAVAGEFVTADLGRLDAAGRLHIAGRSDDVVITGGENVSPAIVERALEALPGIREACVYGRDDPAWGQRVEAAIVTTQDAPGDEAILEALRSTLAPFERPRRLVRLPSLPLGPTGKPDRRALAAASG